MILVDPDDDKREVLSGRLRAQGYRVEAVAGPAEAATGALSSPPAAFIADLWMPSISGVQLCRLLKSEPATAHVPIILRAADNAPRNRFWAEKAGAAAYVPKGRIGELVRALSRAIQQGSAEEDEFFTHLEQNVDIRDRIAKQLDEALYDSVIAAEVRALGNCESFARLFDLFSQFVCQVTSYRWLAVYVPDTGRFGLHCHPRARLECEADARRALKCGDVPGFILEDEDALDQEEEFPLLVKQICFGPKKIGHVALGPSAAKYEDTHLVGLLAAELGGPLRMSALVEESQRLALYDPLTGIMNRRAFSDALSRDLARCAATFTDFALVLMDVDHFKTINDTRGHAAGDLVLEQLGEVLAGCAVQGDHVARWGGEEFVLAIPRVGETEARARGEALRAAIEALQIIAPDGTRIEVTASLGLAMWKRGEHADQLVERADKAMYQAKISGRNRLVTSGELPEPVAEVEPAASAEAAEQALQPVDLPQAASNG